MRIIAGSKARMTLLPPRQFTTRPITDRVKESLFSILEPQLEQAVVADLFCGTGSLGLEALSRGAQHAFMVETDRDALKRLQKNIVKLQFEDCATVIRADAFKLNLSRLGLGDKNADEDSAACCDLIFVDPPYRLSRDSKEESPLGKLLNRLSACMADRALVVVRHERRSVLLKQYQGLYEQDRREYGSMAITFLEKIVG
jgi:16S rRNA (guanine(966)-N(2))-methyltransferase RsmD